MKIDPILKLRYAKGLGDIIKCSLHSRYFRKITKFLTKRDHTCIECSIRANAMNIIFPIPVWKLFFKNEKEMHKNFEKELLEYGYKIFNQNESIEQQNNSCCGKTKHENNNEVYDSEHVKFEGYFLVQRVEEEDSDFKIVTLKFKKM